MTESAPPFLVSQAENGRGAPYGLRPSRGRGKRRKGVGLRGAGLDVGSESESPGGEQGDRRPSSNWSNMAKPCGVRLSGEARKQVTGDR